MINEILSDSVDLVMFSIRCDKFMEKFDIWIRRALSTAYTGYKMD